MLKLLGAELKSSERREPQSGDELAGGWNSMDFRGELSCTSESWKVSDMCHHLGWGQILDFDHYRCPPTLSLVRACGREVGRAELVGDFLCLKFVLKFVGRRGSGL